MKKIGKVLAVTMIVSLVALFGSSNLHADSNGELVETFTKEVEGLYHNIEEIAQIIGEVLEGNDFQESALITSIAGIEERAETLVELGKEYDQPWQSEARKIVEYCDDLNTELGEREFDEMIAGFIRIAVSLNNMEMMVPQYLTGRLDRLAQELTSALAQGETDVDDLEPLVEMLIVHARQLSFAADAFGKKIWKKFTSQVWDLCIELDEAVEEGNVEEIQALLEEMEEPLNMLSKLVK